MQQYKDDFRIRAITTLSSPAQILNAFPRTDAAAKTTASARHAVHRILTGEDDRLLVVVGPCSIHDPAAATEYAELLNEQRRIHISELEIIMRVYFEKPRTTIGWKGLINDPNLDGSCKIEEGLRTARQLLLRIVDLGLPAGCEFLDTITPQYISDLVSWGAIGARTTESQVHRELVSGLSCPIGFKNGTSGEVRIALEAIKAAAQPHSFPAIAKTGLAAIASTQGNEDCHLILRGGRTPNYNAGCVQNAASEALSVGLEPRIMIDASHANSNKNPENQPGVISSVAEQIANGDMRIIGAMLESNLTGGRQDLHPGQPLTYGQSITDGCIDWSTTLNVIEELAQSTRARRLRIPL